MLRNSRARIALAILITVIITSVACAGLGGLQQIIRPPRFEQASGQRAELRLLGPSARSPLGGAGVRIWLQVTNPNPFGFTLSTDVPALSRTIGRLATGGTAPFQLDGTVGIEAGRFGTPTFGPMTLTTGELHVR